MKFGPPPGPPIFIPPCCGWDCGPPGWKFMPLGLDGGNSALNDGVLEPCGLGPGPVELIRRFFSSVLQRKPN